MSLKNLIMLLQRAMNRAGSNLKEDGEFGPKTSSEAAKYEIQIQIVNRPVEIPPTGKQPVNPAYEEAKKHKGKTEHQSTFNRYLSAFWAKVGLPNYKTIIGTTFAWCGLFIFAMNTEVGQKSISGAAGARNWAKYGVEVDWRKNGIPRGAVMHINGNGDCSSGKGNHVTFADGDCTAQDLGKASSTVPGYGGNQGDTVKRSQYAVRNLCAVRWPAEIEKPGPVLKSINCSGTEQKESTR